MQTFPNDCERIEYLRSKTYILANAKERPLLPLLSPVIAKLAKWRAAAPKSIVEPTSTEVMEQEITSLVAGALLDSQGELSVYISDAHHIPNVIREIGRLREITFRATGEGTGRSIDLDSFDSHYLHLFIWNSRAREIVGAYRLAQSDRVLKSFGQRGLYTSTLFSCKRAFLQHLGPALELGRSFVRLEYQKSYTALLLLWRGIGAFVSRNPKYSVLFGPVSISKDYQPGSRQLMVRFLRNTARPANWCALFVPRVHSVRVLLLVGDRKLFQAPCGISKICRHPSPILKPIKRACLFCCVSI